MGMQYIHQKFWIWNVILILCFPIDTNLLKNPQPQSIIHKTIVLLNTETIFFKC